MQAFGQQLSELLYTNIPDRFRKQLEAGLKANPDFLTETDMQQLHQPFELRVVMAIRSDRMSLMNKLKTFLPNILENCYELRSLTIEEAESAILSPAYLPQETGPFDSPVFDYEDQAVASLIDFLSEGRTQEIESFQLQILCEYVERQVILKQGKTLVTKTDIANPDLILENYYLGKINDLPDAARLPARRLIERRAVPCLLVRLVDRCGCRPRHVHEHRSRAETARLSGKTTHQLRNIHDQIPCPSWTSGCRQRHAGKDPFGTDRFGTYLIRRPVPGEH